MNEHIVNQEEEWADKQITKGTAWTLLSFI